LHVRLDHRCGNADPRSRFLKREEPTKMIRPTTTRNAFLCAAAMAIAAFTAFACSGGSTGTSGATGDGGSSGTSGGSGTSGASSGGACGLSLGWKANGSMCNAWMESHCCNEEKACAADGSCASFVSCANACAVPRQDACLNACAMSLPAGVGVIGACSKQTAPAVDVAFPSGCEWP
jgi:hypothetical protein